MPWEATSETDMRPAGVPEVVRVSYLIITASFVTSPIWDGIVGFAARGSAGEWLLIFPGGTLPVSNVHALERLLPRQGVQARNWTSV